MHVHMTVTETTAILNFTNWDSEESRKTFVICIPCFLHDTSKLNCIFYRFKQFNCPFYYHLAESLFVLGISGDCFPFSIFYIDIHVSKQCRP